MSLIAGGTIVESDFIGLITLWAGATPPTGWLICNGQLVSRTTYSKLFALISTTFGAGDGSTTFALPDMTSRTPIGVGTGTKVATFASRSGNVITVTGLTNASNNEFQTGQIVRYSAPSGAMTGLTHNTDYYVVRVSDTTFSLATSLANAQNGTVISLSSDGTGAQTFTKTLTARALGDTGGEDTHAMSISEMIAHNHPGSDATGASGGGGTTRIGTYSGSSTTSLPYVNIASQGGNSAMNNMQPFIAVHYIIRAAQA